MFKSILGQFPQFFGIDLAYQPGQLTTVELKEAPQNTPYFRDGIRIGPGRKTVLHPKIRGKYKAHQGEQECARRVRQMAKGAR